MGGAKKEYDDDDGRTIADMSGIDRPGVFFPRKVGSPHSRSREHSPYCGPEDPQEENGRQAARPWEEDSAFGREERRMYIFGALKAALLIGLAFIVGLGLLMVLLLLIWT